MDNIPLDPACSDARLLVTYLMREGVTVTPETLAAIENAQGADAAVPLNPRCEVEVPGRLQRSRKVGVAS
jgi:hypothetical protein